MAEGKTEGLFGKSAMSRIASADELDHYVKVTNPSAWVVLIAALLLVAGILVWALVAVVPVTVETTGVSTDSRKVICWVDESIADKIKNAGATVKVGDIEAENVRVEDLPMSSSEVVSLLGRNSLIEAFHLDDWNYQVAIELSEEPQHTDFTVSTLIGEENLVPVSITVSETTPILIVTGKE